KKYNFQRKGEDSMDNINMNNISGIGGNITGSRGIKEVMTHKPDIQKIQTEAPQREQYVTGQAGNSVKDNLINLENNAKNITGETTQEGTGINCPFGHDNQYTRYVTGPDGVRHKEIKVMTGWGKDSWVRANDDEPQQEQTQTQQTQTHQTPEAVNADEAVVDASKPGEADINEIMNTDQQQIQAQKDLMKVVINSINEIIENKVTEVQTMPE
ncbi:MAG: hypothetical protein ABRQ37_17395, partial [Candidatus Eremiobacterota bacterium]